ncbi:hypothetical protein VEE70_43660 (plasmid) [Escherichia coli]|uniref:Uncharacterized protein n=1 Tax=Escherichia coli TaxID=562 RepID=A0A2R4PDD6_ECOLX|nr:RepB family plasmid replication initiator protein [Escherichia coli]AVX49178.1 Hypothetical protein [Escherichia coli]BEC21084.1 hypothetical protein VEE70_43660 [Escherichia coli]
MNKTKGCLIANFATVPLLPESQQKNLAELKRSFLDPALKQINEKTPLLAKYSIDDSGKFLFSIIDKQNPV